MQNYDVAVLDQEEPEEIVRLNADVRRAARTLAPREARYLVDRYYQLQRDRQRTANQIRGISEGEPHQVIDWLFDKNHILEKSILSALKEYAEAQTLGRWCLSITGIGPVITAGLMAHIDIARAPTVGHIWRFAGLDPTVTWNPKELRPWNARLKTLCWKIGESFWKQQNREGAYYGPLGVSRKAAEIAKNEAGAFKEQAEAKLAKFKIGKDTEAYKWYNQGMLPPAHIHERAKRWAVKLFLAHYHQVGYEIAYGISPPKPYVLSVLGHAHEIKAPNWPM